MKNPSGGSGALWSSEMSCCCCLRGQGAGNIMKTPSPHPPPPPIPTPGRPQPVDLHSVLGQVCLPSCPALGLSRAYPLSASTFPQLPCAPGGGGGGGLRPLCQPYLGQSSCGPDPHPATWFPAVERATYSPLRVELGPTPGSLLRQS